MQIEIRAEGVKITGYVNVTEKKSRPVITPHGKVVEEIEPRAFESAINRADNINVEVDHDKSHIYATTADGSLLLYEDDIGLHAEALINDKTLIELAQSGKIKGWSFGMFNIQDEIEERTGELPIRKIKALDLEHISLIINMTPIYSATSVELRANGETDIETRAAIQPPQVTEYKSKALVAPFFDNTMYKNRANILKNSN